MKKIFLKKKNATLGFAILGSVAEGNTTICLPYSGYTTTELNCYSDSALHHYFVTPMSLTTAS